MAIAWKKLAFDSEVVKHSLATAENDFLVASGAGLFVKKTLAEAKTILGIGSAGLIQIRHAVETGVISGSTAMPCDDTIPQKNEGFEILTCAITPKSSANGLLVLASLNSGTSWPNPYSAGMALFVNDGAAAVASVLFGYNSTPLFHSMTAGTTDEITFRVRLGAARAGTIYINNARGGSGRVFGGVSATTLTIFEYAQ